MAEYTICPECGAAISPNTPEGLCPNCLLRPDILDPTTPTDPPTELTVSDRIRYFGDYELDQEIARGGMGIVYAARQVTLNRRVAVKLILAGQLADEAIVARFYAEAEAAANLNHPNVVSIHEVGSYKGQHYFSMDFVDGENLAEYARGKPLPAVRAATIVKLIAEAIHYAHQRGVLHRDLKPSNVLIDAEGQPHVTDFGLAKLIGRDSMLTQSGAFLGTPSYTSPEQAAGRQDQVGPHSDVYSLGAILYELLTGRPPFQSSTSVQTLRQVMEVDPVAPKRVDASLPPDLDTICMSCLEKLPDRRYHTAGELAEELGRFLNHEPIHARSAGLFRTVAGWTRRRPGQLAAAVAFAFAGLVGGVYYLAQENAFLRASQTTPGLLRKPGARVEALEKWSAIAGVGSFICLLFALWLNKRIRGRPRRSTEDGLFVQPFYPLGRRIRALAIGIGMLTTLFAIGYAMSLIGAFVWERGGNFNDVVMSYFTSWLGVWLLTMSVADYRRSLFGTPQRMMGGELDDDIERALLKRDYRRAIHLYQQAFPDAGRDEARTFVHQRLDQIHREKPQEFAAFAPRLWDLNWRYMAICALIEAPLVAAYWFVVHPGQPIGIALGWGLGAVQIAGIITSLRLVRYGKRVLAMLPPTAALIALGAVSYVSGDGHVLGQSLLFGACCGAAVVACGLVRKKRQPITE